MSRNASSSIYGCESELEGDICMSKHRGGVHGGYRVLNMECYDGLEILA